MEWAGFCGDADENAELCGTDAERFEGAVIEAGDGARALRKLRRRRSRAVEVSSER